MRSPIRARRLGSAVAVLAIAAALTGCGGKASAQAIVVRSADATVEAKTAKLYEKISVVGGAASAMPATTATGRVDLATRQATMDMTVAGQDAQVLLVGSVIYEKIPALQTLTGKPWLKVDLDTLGEAAGVQGLGNLLQSSSSDPAATLAYLRGAGSVREVGSETVRGTETTHYKAVIDLEAAADKAPAALAKTIRQVAKLMGATTQPVEVWVDSDGRARRYTETVDFTKANLPSQVPKAALPTSITILVELFDFGTPVSVHAPDPADVSDFKDLLNRGGSSTPS